MFNSVLAVVIIVLVGVSAFSISIANYYNETVRTGLETKARTASDFFANYITNTYANYYDSAYRYIESFADVNLIELQFVSTEGRVQISSNSITSGTTVETPDLVSAVANGRISSWAGSSPTTGERIMAVSTPMLHTADGQIVGVMRYVTSMRLVDAEIFKNILSAVGLGIAAVALVIFTNMFFIRSVVYPMKEITTTARRIADGSYGIQITRKYRDEIGEMVDAINEMSIKISQSEKTQTEFISSVSHELRTPLTAIAGWGETLIYDEKLSGEERKGVAIILKEARRLTKMVEELLDFTRMQDGRFTLNMEEIDVSAELEDSIFTYREILKQEELELEYEPYDGDMPLINGDPARLRQVFLNILDNAAKYARSGKKIVVSIQAKDSWVSICIRDFGPGVPEDELENIKLKFYKGSSKERGSGIGLAVCDEIVRYHGGTLTLSNAKGGGLLAEIRLPVGTEILDGGESGTNV